MKHFPFILALILSLFGSLVFIASAQNYVPLAPLPIGEGGTTPPSYNMTTYLSGAIKLLLAIGASLAILMTVIGGTQYVAAGISPDAKSKAKDMITNSFIGLALMLVSYLILNSINPKLVQFDLSLKKTKMNVTDVPLSVSASCGTFPKGLSPLSGIALEIENGNKVIWSSDDQNVQKNLDKLKVEYEKAKRVIEKESIGTFGSYSPLGLSVSVNSAYRPFQYQKHLYEIFDLWINKGLKDFPSPSECDEIKKAVRKEYSDHSLGSRVSKPNGMAPHVRGTGLDLQINPPVDMPPGYDPYAQAQGILDKHPEIDLIWQSIPGDRAHFNLQNRPYNGPGSTN